MRTKLLVAVVLGALACSGDPGESAGRGEPVATPARSNESTQLLSAGGAQLRAPAAWSDVSAEVRDRLTAAGRRRDPVAHVVIDAVRPPDERAPLLSVTAIEHAPAYARDAAVRRVLADAEQATRDAAAARGATLAFTSRCTERYCEYSFELAGEMHQRGRVWKIGDVLFEVSCGCLVHGCAYFDTCTLPLPPPDARHVDD